MPSHSSSPRRDPSAAAVWAPWLAAPLFALLPVAGCGLAGGLRPSASLADAGGRHADAPVVTVVTADVRQVAFGPAAH